ncbi:hypothetical protein KAFR_0D02220 [Kazachstania africana CBS 2517]|uniref:NUA/TPR/MLP1-2-like domain-containing protein n=1 Tax=Kazachstania africana (strain ATCC 22294 / BCRC 22015 / CBS 2517 / CECT 1963 / NBRC 1671 / NRRL Y-8276) TaxID=1071382 RepID=H2AU19_KAZAF|nr:hypothetical protein KAFR_0D02220 [Kazachstania africana CBS 2517]CCF57869.1 hypothetical protein KAFR_0D02220 [Kazachstania africana CBS 2517]
MADTDSTELAKFLGISDIELSNINTELRSKLESSVDNLIKEKLNLKSTIEETESTYKNKIKNLEDEINILAKTRDISGPIRITGVEAQAPNNATSISNINDEILTLQRELERAKSEHLISQSEAERSLKQSELVREHNQWLEEHLVKTTEELMTQKQSILKMEEKDQEIDNLRHEVSILKKNNDLLLGKNQELSENVQEKLIEIKQKSDDYSTKQQEFLHEIGLKDRINSSLETQLKEIQQEKSIQNEDNTSRAESQKIMEQLIDTRKQLKDSRNECTRLKSYVNEFINDVNGEYSSSSSLLKKELLKVKEQKDYLETQVENFITELEIKVPVIDSLEKKNKDLEKELSDVTSLVDRISIERESLEKEFQSFKRKSEHNDGMIQTLTTQRSDLAHQIQFLLLILGEQATTNALLSKDETDFIRRLTENDTYARNNDSQSIISERLLKFADITELQKQNMDILATVRHLAGQLEEQEKLRQADHHTIERKTLEEAKKALLDLQEYTNSLERKLETFRKERDVYKLLSKGKSPSSNKPSECNDIDKHTTGKLQNELQQTREYLTKEIEKLTRTNKDILNKKKELEYSMKKMESAKEYAEGKAELIENNLLMLQENRKSVLEQNDHLQQLLSQKEAKLAELTQDLHELTSQYNLLQIRFTDTQSQSNSLRTQHQTTQKELFEVVEEKNALKVKIHELEISRNECKGIQATVELKLNERLTEYQLHEQDLLKIIEKQEDQIRDMEVKRAEELNWYQKNFPTQTETEIGLPVDMKKEGETGRQSNRDTLESQKSGSPGFTDLGTDSSVRKSTSLPVMQVGRTEEESKEAKKCDALTDSSQVVGLPENVTKKEKDLIAQIEQLASDKKELKTSLQAIRAEYQHLHDQLQLEKNSFDTEKASLNNELDKIMENNSLTEVAKKSLEDDLHDVEMKLEEERQKHEETNATLSEKELLCEKMIEEISGYREELSKSAEMQVDIQHTRELEDLLDLANKRIDDLCTQNNLLHEQLNATLDLEDTQNKDDIKDIIVCMKRERDTLQKKLAIVEREGEVLRERCAGLKSELDAVSKGQQWHNLPLSNLLTGHEKILDELKEVHLLRENNVSLLTEVNQLKHDNCILNDELSQVRKLSGPLQDQKNNTERYFKEKDQEISLYKDEIERWKKRWQQMVHRQDDTLGLEANFKNEIDSLKGLIEERTKEKEKLSEKFQLLKKQAHEKLDANKIHIQTLNNDLSEIKASNLQLEEVMKEKDKKIREIELTLKENLEKFDKDEKLVSEKTFKENEAKLNKTITMLQKLNETLNQEVVSLREEINVLRKKDDETNQLISTMKLDFEREKDRLIEEKVRELNEKFESGRNEVLSKQSENVTNDNTGSNVDKLKQELRKDWEEQTLQRIEEAKENLKRHIRLPSEEKIQRIIEKRRAELESDFDKRVEEKANLIALADKADMSPDELKQKVRRELEHAIEQDLQAKLETIRTKAFEEGKRQAEMKTTLLERKLSKLESQVAKDNESGSKVRKSISGLTKIDVNSPQLYKDNTGTRTEAVLKLRPTAKVDSGKDVSNDSNPFTSPTQELSKSNSPAALPIVHMAPTFSFTPGKSTGTVNKELNKTAQATFGAPTFSNFGTSTAFGGFSGFGKTTNDQSGFKPFEALKEIDNESIKRPVSDEKEDDFSESKKPKKTE